MLPLDFIQILDSKKYLYEIKGSIIVITNRGSVTFNKLKSIPSGVSFENNGNVNLDSLEIIPKGTRFKNKGHLGLDAVKKIPEGIIFKNVGYITLNSLEKIPHGVEFRNSMELVPYSGNTGFIQMNSLIELPFDTKFINFSSVSMDSLRELPDFFDFRNINGLSIRGILVKDVPSNIRFPKRMFSSEMIFKDLYVRNPYSTNENLKINGISPFNLLMSTFRRII
jgi:hypothetical protein